MFQEPITLLGSISNRFIPMTLHLIITLSMSVQEPIALKIMRFEISQINFIPHKVNLI